MAVQAVFWGLSSRAFGSPESPCSSPGVSLKRLAHPSLPAHLLELLQNCWLTWVSLLSSWVTLGLWAHPSLPVLLQDKILFSFYHNCTQVPLFCSLSSLTTQKAVSVPLGILMPLTQPRVPSIVMPAAETAHTWPWPIPSARNKSQSSRPSTVMPIDWDGTWDLIFYWVWSSVTRSLGDLTCSSSASWLCLKLNRYLWAWVCALTEEGMDRWR